MLHCAALQSGEGETYYASSGALAHRGRYSNGTMDGAGAMFYEASGKLLFNGTFRCGRFYAGKLYDALGNVVETLNGGGANHVKFVRKFFNRTGRGLK